MACAVLCLKAVSMRLYFDEYTHAHNLWLVSIRHTPHKDFWCNYSALSYIILSPYFRLFPESIYVIYDLRFLGLGAFLLGIVTAFHYHSRSLGTRWFYILLPVVIVMQSRAVCTLLVEFRPDAYAAALAIWALALMFREPTPLRSGLITALSGFSVLLMPKYVTVLLLGNLVYFGYQMLKLKHARQPMISAAVAGARCLVSVRGALMDARHSIVG